MSGNADNLLLKVGDPGSATNLTVGYTAGATSITVGSTANWTTTGEGVIFAIDRAEVVNGVERQIAGAYNEFEGTVASATSITNVDWVRGAGDTDYDAGALTRVYIPVSAERENRIVDWGLTHADQDGTLKAGAVDVAGVLASNVVTNAKVLDDTLLEAKINVSTASSLRSKNLLYNGNMNVWQRNVTATPNDDVYTGADRWNFLTETNGAWTVARDTDVPVGSQYSMKFTNVTLNNQCAIVQILENRDAKQLDDGTVSLSFYAKTSGTEIANLRAGIISWGSTADSVTSDVFGTWASDGTSPTLATNWTYENTPSNLALTSTWTRYTIDNVAIDTATVNNVAVVIWVDDGTVAANDDFWITQVQLNYGAKNSAFQHRPYAEELMLCQRYCYSKSTVGSAQTAVTLQGFANNSSNAAFRVPISTPMRIDPTLTATGTDWQLADSATAGLDVTALNISSDPASTHDNPILAASVSASATQYRPYYLRGDGGGTRQYILEAEL